MVKLSKSPLPPNVSIKSEKDYHSEPLVSLIKNDCYDKCYICEDDESTSPEIEHRVPHHGNTTLKYDWNNLFFCCRHCNAAKNDLEKTGRQNAIIDCAVIDPEEFIEILLSSLDYTAKVIVHKQNNCTGIDETIALLERVYNSHTPPLLENGCAKLRKKIIRAMLELQQQIDEYRNENNPTMKQNFHTHIVQNISRVSAFTAFKRGYVKRNKELFQLFESAL